MTRNDRARAAVILTLAFGVEQTDNYVAAECARHGVTEAERTAAIDALIDEGRIVASVCDSQAIGLGFLATLRAA